MTKMYRVIRGSRIAMVLTMTVMLCGLGFWGYAQNLQVDGTGTFGGNVTVSEGSYLYVGPSAAFRSDATYMHYSGPRHFYINTSFVVKQARFCARCWFYASFMCTI